MKLLHTSDWHLGISFYNRSLLEEQNAMVDALLEAVQQERPDAVVISGDVFDRAVVGAEAIAIYNRAMTALCADARVPVLLIAGNHDGAARLASLSGLLERVQLHIAGRLALRPPIRLMDAAFHLLPFFNADEARYLFPDLPIHGTVDAMNAVAGALWRQLVPGACNILVGHCFAAGGQAGESDRAAAVGGSARVPLTAFAGFDYVALGHLHRAQTLGNVRYCGTPLPYSFAEAAQVKSFTLVDTKTMSLREWPVKPLRGLRAHTGPLDKLLDAARQESGTLDYVRLEVTDHSATPEVRQAFRNHYPNLVSLLGQERQANRQVTLTMDDIARLTPQGILTRFCREIVGEEPDAEQRRWFDEAVSIRGEGAQ